MMLLPITTLWISLSLPLTLFSDGEMVAQRGQVICLRSCLLLELNPGNVTPGKLLTITVGSLSECKSLSITGKPTK